MQHRSFSSSGIVESSRSLATLTLQVILLVISVTGLGFAHQSNEKTFSSPQEAIHALFAAVQGGNEQAVRDILGGDSELVSSQSEDQDRHEREQFARKYQEMHRLVREADGTTFLYIGAENWPFPVPLVSKAGQWFFDADAGKQEIVFRQVGENESTAIETCQALASAGKQDRARPAVDDTIEQYAKALLNVSPEASHGGPPVNTDASAPFHGYYFRAIKPENKDALGKGDAFIAYPARYRSTGVMTFVVNKDGVVYERDLGAKTEKVAEQMKVAPPSHGWQVADLP